MGCWNVYSWSPEHLHGRWNVDTKQQADYSSFLESPFERLFALEAGLGRWNIYSQIATPDGCRAFALLSHT